MTNGDRFRKMTNRELAITIMCPNEMGLAEIECNHEDNENHLDCCKCCLEWLCAEED